MLILGIETSCDETAAAVVEDGREVRSIVLQSQQEIHGRFDGVVPELACRRHVDVIQTVVKKALEQAGVDISEVSAVAVTEGPGLVGALLVGVSFAKALAYQSRRPFIPIHHLEGHVAAVGLEPDYLGRVRFPAVALIVSGGHTNLYLVSSFQEYRLLGKTLDDAAGEAFDKAAKMLGLGFPGGPAMDRTAKGGDPTAIRFPRPGFRKDTDDFSFSGLKTALKYYLNQGHAMTSSRIPDIAASFQQALVDVLISKSLTAVARSKAEALIVVGGVAANSVLREQLKKECDRMGVELFIPRPVYCTDNGAMIAAAGFHRYAPNLEDSDFPFTLGARATLPLG